MNDHQSIPGVMLVIAPDKTTSMFRSKTDIWSVLGEYKRGMRVNTITGKLIQRWGFDNLDFRLLTTDQDEVSCWASRYHAHDPIISSITSGNSTPSAHPRKWKGRSKWPMIEELLQKGHTVSEIAKIMQTSRQEVSYVVAVLKNKVNNNDDKKSS